MKPEEAKKIANKKNDPLIKKFWKKNSLEDFFYKHIKETAEKGEYYYDFMLPMEHYNSAVAKDVHNKLVELGYVVEVEFNDKIKTIGKEELEAGWHIRVIWA